MVKRVRRGDDGKYRVKGVAYDQLVGSRAQVYHDNAYKTPGGLTKEQLVMNKHGRIVSKSKFASASREQRLSRHGYDAKKGKFGYVRSKTRRRRRRKTKRRGASKTHT